MSNNTLTGVSALVPVARGWLRIKRAVAEIDAEIAETIEAAQADMSVRGIDVERLCPDTAPVSGMKPLAVRCIKLYVMANFGTGGSSQERDRWATCYESLSQSMSLTDDYRKRGVL